MRQDKEKPIKRVNKERKLNKRWHKVVGVLAAVVVFCTAYALTMPALTLNGNDSQDIVSSSDAITVTFKIDNASYTNDATTGASHVASTKDYSESGDGLTYENSGGAYTITGTGSLVSISIPANTSLKDNGAEIPQLTIQNNGGTEYVSDLINWANTNGMVCNENTVFSEDTTLKLCLYEPNDVYTLNFVCGDSNNHSVTESVTGYPEAQVSDGQSVSASYVPSTDDMNSRYEADGCKHGKASNESFKGWYVKNSNGKRVEFGAGTALSADYADENGVINVYAIWSKSLKPSAVEDTQHTVTFYYDETVIETRTVNDGEELGTLPDMSSYENENLEFVAWTDADENEILATDTVTSDMNVYALFVDPNEPTYYSVILHDVSYTGEEGDITIDLSVEEGTPLSTVLLEGVDTLEDGTSIADCVWYEAGAEESVDMTKCVYEDIDLYTYSYRLTFTPVESTGVLSSLFSLLGSRSVEVSEDGTTLTITLREGEKPKYSDFVINGVDYSDATWTYTDAGGDTKKLNIADLIANGATESIVATADASELATTDMTVNYYVCVDDEWVKVGSTNKTFGPENSRWYVTLGILEEMYGVYGFDASTFTNDGYIHFPHTNSGSTTVWSDAGISQSSSGSWHIPVGNVSTWSYDIYYVPANSMTTSTGSATAESLKSSNSFYSINVLDPNHDQYASTAEIPSTQYVLKGNSTSFTLKGSASFWEANSDTVSFADNGDGTCTVTITNSSEPVVIKPAGMIVVRYLIEADSSELEATGAGGSSYSAASQAWYDLPTIMGKSEYLKTVSQGSGYTVLAPDSTLAKSKANQVAGRGEYLATYTFQGWKINGSTTVVSSGTTWTSSDLTSYAEGGVVTLTPDWSLNPETDSVRTNTVSFWVNVTSLTTDSSDTSITNMGNFSDAVYTTAVYGGDDASLVAVDSGNTQKQWLIFAGTDSGLSVVEADTLIRSLADTGYNGVTIANFPTDEEILSRLRSWGDRYGSASVTLDGEEVALSDLTTDNFTIRWYVFKYDDSDAWHIDGKLVPKTGKLTITKSFYGVSSAVSSVKDDANYGIEVASSDTSKGTSYELCLEPKGSETTTGETGYTKYIADTDTYVWEIDVVNNLDYTVSEHNYVYSNATGVDDPIATVPEYLLSNSDAENAGKWQSYSDSKKITVTGHTYSTDTTTVDYQTVSLVNNYLHQSSLLVRKIDGTTGYTIGDVSFTLHEDSVDGPISSVWNVSGTNVYYLFNPSSLGISNAVEITTGVMTGDSRGYFELIGLKDAAYAGKEYYLVEGTAPDGYSRIPGGICLVTDKDGEVTLKSGNEYASLVPEDDDGLLLRVSNYAEKTQLVVNKSWLDGTNLPVTLQLYRNGVSMGSQYCVTLDGTTDTNGETDPWACTWDNLPLYADGEAAHYTVRETWIGDPDNGGVAYDPSADTDGYENYSVTRSELLYEFRDGTRSDSPLRTGTDGNTEYATIAYLTVSNKVDNGEVSFAKLDNYGNPVPGATFSIYADEAKTQLVETATADASGLVTFDTLLPGTYYVMQETSTPDGYIGNDNTYTVVVTGKTQHIYDSTDESQTDVTSIVNEVDEAAITLQKISSDTSELLDGSTFQLYKLNGASYATYGDEFEVADGNYSFGNLPAGTYKLVEVEAPDGYNIMTKSMVFTINDKSVTVQNDAGSDWTLVAPTGTQTSYVIKAVNHPGEELPYTGGMGTIWYFAGGALCVGLAVVCGTRLRRRVEGSE